MEVDELESVSTVGLDVVVEVEAVVGESLVVVDVEVEVVVEVEVEVVDVEVDVEPGL